MSDPDRMRAKVVRLEQLSPVTVQAEIYRLAAVRPDLADRLMRAALRLRELEHAEDRAWQPHPGFHQHVHIATEPGGELTEADAVAVRSVLSGKAVEWTWRTGQTGADE